MSKKETASESSAAYRSVFKATSLFGGVKVYQILLLIVKSKIVAVLLGTAGVGLQGLYQSILSMASSISSLGLSQSAVRDVSEAAETGDKERIGRTVGIMWRLLIITGTIGMLAVMLLSPILSKTTFGDYTHIVPIIIISTTILLDQLTSGPSVLLQGLHKLKRLATASTVGMTVGFLITIPLYYIWGADGIVPVFVLNSLASIVILWFLTRDIKYPSPKLGVKEVLRESGPMIGLGIALSLSGIVSNTVGFAIRSFIRGTGGSEMVGLYQAGVVIVSNYVGLVFSAMGTDFYPRLAAVNKDDEKCREIVSRQGVVILHILAPLLCVCIILMPFILRLLYSDQFIDAGPFILWSCPGMMFNLAAWLMSYLFMAKGDSKVYLLTLVAGDLVILALSFLLCRPYGLMGLGIAFSVGKIVGYAISRIVAGRRYGFHFSADYAKGFSIQFIIVALCLCAVLLFDGAAGIVISGSLALVSSALGLWSLNRKMQFI